MRVLILGPDIRLHGGVANYYRIINKHIGFLSEYMVIGRRYGVSRLFYLPLIVQDCIYLVRYLKTNKIDIVHMNTSFQYGAILRDLIFLLLIKIFRKKIIIFFRGWNITFSRFVRRYLSFPFNITFMRVDAIVVLASEFKRYLEKMGYKKKIFVESTIVDERIFSSEYHSFNKYHKKQNFAILFLSRLVENKGVFTAIKTYELIKKKYPYVSMTIAGDGKLLSSVEKYVRAHHLNGIRILGAVNYEKRNELYMEHQCFLFPTNYGEGCPNVLLEAMAYGLPIITRPVGGISDFFINGKMGYITDSKNPVDFAKYIGELIENPKVRTTIGAFNTKYAKDYFAADIVAKRLIKIYQHVLR